MPAQIGTAVRPRARLLTWRGVRPARPGEGRLADASVGQESGEFSMQKCAHRRLHREVSSILNAFFTLRRVT